MAYIRIGTFCPVCGEFINGGVIAAFDDRPENTALLEDFEQVSFYCEHCGTSVYTPDYDSMCEVEEGEEPNDDDYDEDEESY